MIEKYDDIINLPRPISKKHSPMALINRAAQFAPFAALTGHDAAVQETERLTQDRIEIDKYLKEELNNKLAILMKNLKDNPRVKIRYFQADEKKPGGSYLTINSLIKGIDRDEGNIILEDGLRIAMEEIIDIQGDIFDSL